MKTFPVAMLALACVLALAACKKEESNESNTYVAPVATVPASEPAPPMSEYPPAPMEPESGMPANESTIAPASDATGNPPN